MPDVSPVQPREHRIRLLRQLIALERADPDEAIPALLAEGASALGMEGGYFSRVEHDTYSVVTAFPSEGPLRAGDSLRLDDTYCATTLQNEAPFALGDTLRQPDVACRDRFGLGAYLGAPVFVGGKAFGTISFVSRRPVDLSEEAVDLVAALAAWVGKAVDTRQKAPASLHGVAVSASGYALRTPLTTVTGLADLLHGTSLTPEQVRLVEGIEAAAQTLGAVVGEIVGDQMEPEDVEDHRPDEQSAASREEDTSSSVQRRVIVPAGPEASEPELPAFSPVVIAAQGPDLTGTRVLVAEDNPTNRYLARTMLESWGVAVTEAHDGAHAVNRVASDGPYDLVLMDLQMPEMDGIEATRVIREDLGIPTGVLPIVALTASVLACQHNEVIAAGLDDFMLKPFRPDALRQLIAKWTHRDGPILPEVPTTDTLAVMFDEDPEAVGQLVVLFGEESADALAQLTQAASDGDLERCRDLAHALRGQACAVGAEALIETTLRIEQAANEGDTGTLRVEVALARRQCSTAVEELERLYCPLPVEMSSRVRA